MTKRIFTLGLLATTSAFFLSCSNNDDSTYVDPNATLFTEVLTNVPNTVIVDTYKQLNDNATILKTAINALNHPVNETQLTAIKNAWQATRAPWEQSESFLYGPVGIEEVVDPAIDSWPVDVEAIDNIIANGAPITAASLETNDDARGFHTIEYFVWGITGNKQASEITPREIEFLKAAANDLQSNTQKLYDAWKTSGTNAGSYANQFINAGQSGSVYVSQKAALAEMVEGLFGIADEVSSGKIEEPLNGNAGSAKPDAEESRFSNNSKLDFANNIRSIRNIYLGDFNGVSGKGLSDIVAANNSTLDNKIKAEIEAAITAIEEIPNTFTHAISHSRPAVQNAQEKVAALKTLLESQLLPYVNNL